ncbi:MAG: CotH kinase family protein [Bacteroidetes bacterium]|nr:CotH kinase family protein [Bacteroidota bacterium]MBU1579872.1 CotH kinase family protein [Bacteroidota bacterium]MBU2466141.1 CotH kinase family protein [Bacteroidota bacterium]MBU2556899.1 CotH kinase family protein [Bacteroidota bacterium]
MKVKAIAFFLFCSYLLLFGMLPLTAQNPEAGFVYNDEVVPRIEITIHPDTLSWIYDNVESDVEFHAGFVFDNGTVRDSVDFIGFRLRGNTSRYSQKKSFKVSFNTWTDGGNFHGVEKLNLNGEHNDPSIMRAKLMWDLLAKWGIPVPRANHVQVYINGNYHGLYINVEHIDEEFVDLRFGNKDGNMYKCLYPADLDYLGDDPDLYKLEESGRRVYELKRNEELDDYSDLANFIEVLNNISNADFGCEIDEVFNSTDYLKVIAADVLCGNWDGYIFNKNNYYLYNNEATNRFEYLIYDVDNTFGIDWFNEDWMHRSPYDWEMGGNETRPLYTRLMDNDILRRQFTFVSEQLMRQIDLDSLFQSLQTRQSLIAPHVELDPYYPLDYGYSFADFQRALDEVIGEHVKTSIFGFLTTRFGSMQSQLENTDAPPMINHISHKRLDDNRLFIGAWADAQFPFGLDVQFVIDEDISDNAAMYDDGQHGDGTAGDLYYGAILEQISPETGVHYQLVAVDSIEQITLKPCTYRHVRPLSGDQPLLTVNEFMADNDNFNADEFGNYSDWLELYNGDTEAVFLADYYLTDKLDNPDKWQMPEVYLEPGAFMLFWADDEESLGENHTNFKLSKGGEAIGIFNGLGAPVDTLTFGEQDTDVSYGRLPDGSPEWIFFTAATPGESNEFSATPEWQSRASFGVFPNPANGSHLYFTKSLNIQLYSLQGQLLLKQQYAKQLDISRLAPGMYLLRSAGHQPVLFVRE